MSGAPDGVQAYSMMLRREHHIPHSEIPPERRLMVALLRDAMRCIDKYRHARDSHGRRLFEQDAEWILSNDASWVYAFVRVCEALDLDPAAVRRSLGLRTGGSDRPAGRANIATSALQERRLPSC